MTTTHMYTVRTPNRAWARIWITDDGCFTVISDHGNYGYWWGSPGCEFRQFLCNCDDYYLIGKLSHGDTEYDGEATRQRIREELTHWHDLGEDTREELILLADADLSDVPGFTRWLEEDGEDGRRIIEYPERCMLAVYRPPIRVQMFVKHIWPHFVEQLKAELVAEAVMPVMA